MSTLTVIRDAVEAQLKDSTNTIWTTAELDEHIRRAIREINRVKPQTKSTTITSVNDQYEYSLSSITGLLRIVDIWFPYDSASPDYPPTRPKWSLLADNILLLDASCSPDGTDKIRVIYWARHTLNGLDAETTTTLDAEQQQLIILAAAAFAVEQRAHDAVDQVHLSGYTPLQLANWARTALRNYERELTQYAQRLIASEAGTAAIEGTV